MPNENFPWNRDDPLARITRNGNGDNGNGDTNGYVNSESKKAHAALMDYWRMGSGRSIRKLHNLYLQRDGNGGATNQPPTTRYWTIENWSFRHAWQARIAKAVEQWDTEMNEALKERQLEVLHQDWELGGRLRELAVEILDASPSFVHHSRKAGRPRVITTDGTITDPGTPDVLTLALSSSDLARIAKLGSDLARAAAMMETERTVQKLEFVVVREDEPE